MSKGSFDELSESIEENITIPFMKYKNAISLKERLALTLGNQTHGCLYRISQNSVTGYSLKLSNNSFQSNNNSFKQNKVYTRTAIYCRKFKKYMFVEMCIQYIW